ncbi:PQQ-dependent sugar dehydrogenase [Halomonas garicola]|uniref:PQQ-dependent sugar dehydrogenase n=1 Tax=Halomonas garicola TaxID=1690008 RepID=UPI00289B41B0|nr:PQQ-dependent sugar dehydrogenase [Halomonas garicola]
MLRRLTITLLLSGLTLGAQAQAAETLIERLESDHHTLRLERIASGLEHPWSLVFLPGGDLLVSERPGHLARIDQTGQITRLDGVPEVSTRGQDGGDNYGWPVVSRGNDYATNQPIGRDSAPGMRDPLHDFDGRFAPSGLAEVTGDTFSAWQGHFLAGGLASERLVRLALEGDDVVEHEMVLEGEIGRIRDVRQGPAGAIYLLKDAADGALYRLTPALQP